MNSNPVLTKRSNGDRILITPSSLKAGLPRKILIMGLPGAGKTTLAHVLAPALGAVLFNADEVRSNINRDLGFSIQDRIEQARRLGWLCDRVVEAGGSVIADFVCPTPETRVAFGTCFIIWMDRIKQGRFEDTNRLFVPPHSYALRVPSEGSPEEWVGRIHTHLGLGGTRSSGEIEKDLKI